MKKTLPFVFLTLLLGCHESDEQVEPNAMATYTAQDYLDSNEVYNPESVIPPQCYTKTEQQYNPCYVCHQSYPRVENRPNKMADFTLQGEYQFSEIGMTNSWRNLFVDRSKDIEKIRDNRIQDWVRQDNYQALIQQLEHNEQWKAQSPIIHNLGLAEQAFEANGVAKDGSHWVAYNFKPFPSTFWPTNGSTGDAMIRLSDSFREQNGMFSQDVYFANLALVEMAIKDLDTISVPNLSEKAVGVDLNLDGVLSDSISSMKRLAHYVGDAYQVALSAQLYPQGTEFLHTVRYLGVDTKGDIHNAKRMKEVRYMKKHAFKSPTKLVSSYYGEAKEKDSEALPQTVLIGDQGVNNGFGWTINGFIEDKNGELRHQNGQELAYCNGCHKTVGSTIDQVFSFARKVEGTKGWGYVNLKAIQDVATISEAGGEYVNYMSRVNGGDEFRQNKEMLAKWFDDNGRLKKAKIESLDSIYPLIVPSKSRALALNKAYYLIMREQSYLFGRDATIHEAKNIFHQVDDQVEPLPANKRVRWDMRLAWNEK